jgi:hypothetical protein
MPLRAALCGEEFRKCASPYCILVEHRVNENGKHASIPPAPGCAEGIEKDGAPRGILNAVPVPL